MDGSALEMRCVLLETKSCWCKDTSLLTELEGSPTSVCTETDDLGARFWFTVVLKELTSYRVGRVMEDISLIFPADAWYYGSTEDHVCLSRYGHEIVHYCITVVVGCAKPYSLASIRSGAENVLSGSLMEKLDVSPCPAHSPTELEATFASIATWVKNRIDFIQAAGRGGLQGSLQCGVFGFSGILWVLKKQFGAASGELATEMALAKENSDEEDGIFDSSVVPMWSKRSGSWQWTYVEAPGSSVLNPVVL